MPSPDDDLAERLAGGERIALARALSLAEREPARAAALIAGLAGRIGRGHVIGITGPPGAGKSTLVGALARELLGRNCRVAILAVDPSSPLSGGALLGDRFRIGEAIGDERLFIRSAASRGDLGGLTRAARGMIDLMDAAGYDLILVETVGTGQSEIDVAALADTTLVVFPPGLGDEMQAIKAGVLEVADLLVVSKGDLPAAGAACSALESAMPLWSRSPPLHRVSAASGDGIGALAESLLARGRACAGRRLDPRAPAAAPTTTAALQRLCAETASALAERVDRHLRASLDADLVLSVSGESDPSMRGFLLGLVAGALLARAAAAGIDLSLAGEAPGAGDRLRFRIGR